MADKRERKANFTDAEKNVLQTEVEKNFNILNEKFGDGVTNQRKNDVWKRISLHVSALGVASRSVKECKDKWAFTFMNSLRQKTGGGPPPKKLSLAVERTIDLCKDSSSFKGIDGFETVFHGKYSRKVYLYCVNIINLLFLIAFMFYKCVENRYYIFIIFVCLFTFHGPFCTCNDRDLLFSC